MKKWNETNKFGLIEKVVNPFEERTDQEDTVQVDSPTPELDVQQGRQQLGRKSTGQYKELIDALTADLLTASNEPATQRKALGMVAQKIKDAGIVPIKEV